MPSTCASVVCASDQRLPGLDGARLRRGALGIGARRLCARAQLIVDERVRRRASTSRRSTSACGGDDRLLRAHDAEERGADSILHGEPRQCLYSARARTTAGFRLAHAWRREGRSRTAPTRTSPPPHSPRRCRPTRTAARDRRSRESPTAAAAGRRCCWPWRGWSARARRARQIGGLGDVRRSPSRRSPARARLSRSGSDRGAYCSACSSVNVCAAAGAAPACARAPAGSAARLTSTNHTGTSAHRSQHHRFSIIFFDYENRA